MTYNKKFVKLRKHKMGSGGIIGILVCTVVIVGVIIYATKGSDDKPAPPPGPPPPPPWDPNSNQDSDQTGSPVTTNSPAGPSGAWQTSTPYEDCPTGTTAPDMSCRMGNAYDKCPTGTASPANNACRLAATACPTGTSAPAVKCRTERGQNDYVPSAGDKPIYKALMEAGVKWTHGSEIYDALKIPALNDQAAWLKPQESNTFNALFGAPATRPISGGTGLCFLMKVSPDPAWFFCGINGGGLNSQTPVWTLGTKDTQAALTGSAANRALTPNLGHTPTYFRNNVSGNGLSTWGTDAPNTRRQCGTSAGWTPYGPPSLLAAAPNDLQVRAQNGLFNFQLWGKDSSAGMGLKIPPVYGTPDGWPAPGTSPVGNYNAVFFSVGWGGKPQCGDGFPGSTESTPNPGFLACEVYARLCWAPGVTKASITGFATINEVTLSSGEKYSDRENYNK